jgi:predicted aspartyl protease
MGLEESMEVELTFERAGGSNPLLLVPVGIRGQGPFSFVLDTGAGLSLVTPALAKTLGLEVTAEKEGMGAGARVRIGFAELGSLRLGNVGVPISQVGITDELGRIAQVIGARVDGALGHDVLGRFRVTVDYRRGTVLLSGPGALAGAAKGAVGAAADDPELEFQLAHPSKPLVMVPVEVDGRGPYRFALDTGASATVLSTEVAAAVGVSLTEIPPVTGAGGTLRASTGRASSVAVGSARVADLPVVVSELAPLSAAVGTRMDGILGYSYLSRFTVTIDYPAHRLRLEGIPQSAA